MPTSQRTSPPKKGEANAAKTGPTRLRFHNRHCQIFPPPPGLFGLGTGYFPLFNLPVNGFGCQFLICWRMAGWEKISAALNQLRTMNRSAGTSQLATDGAAVLTSLNTSPGAAKTFINRPASDVAGAGGATGGAQVLAEWVPCVQSGLIHYLGKTQPKLQEMSVFF